MTVLKVMFTAIVTAMLGLTLLTAVGVVDYAEIYVNPTTLGPQVVGGVIFGVGFVVGGYCPGTSVVAATQGKLDAFAFLGGALAGVLVYSAVFPLFASFASADGERFLLMDWLGLSHGTVAFLVTLMAIGMFAGAEFIEHAMRTRGQPKAEKKAKPAAPTAGAHPVAR
ncbi:YeeE/YedE family protein [Myxococcota bacterium]|nr:YeeE/YedE family protein [Myxococcota bacterium]